MKPEGDGHSSCYWYTWNNPQRIVKGTGGGQVETI